MPLPEDSEGLPVKVKVAMANELSLPEFIRFDEKLMSMSITPTKAQYIDTYTIEVSLSDGYARPYTEYFKIIVEDPLASDKIKRNKDHQADGSSGKSSSNNKQFKIFKCIIKIKKVTRDAKFTIKFICPENSQKLLKAVTHDSFLINWLQSNKEPVSLNFTIDSLNLLESTMTFNLSYTNPQLVSASNVINETTSDDFFRTLI